jgi:hypothetical protein
MKHSLQNLCVHVFRLTVVIVCYLLTVKSLEVEIRVEGRVHLVFDCDRDKLCFVVLAMGRLKGIPTVLSPDLLHALSSMGHGDEIGECMAASFCSNIRYRNVHVQNNHSTAQSKTVVI